MKSDFDILEKIDEVNFRWLEATQDGERYANPIL